MNFTGALAATGGVIVIVALAIPAFILYGATIWVLWGWFVVPLGVPQITIAWAIGLSALTHLLVPPKSHDPRSREWWETVLDIVARPGTALLIGYVAKSYM